MPTNGISGTNNNKATNYRPVENPKFLIITNSVLLTPEETIVSLVKKGASVHYLIHKDGYQDQRQLENNQTFTCGKSQFRKEVSLNQTSVNVMFINSGYEAYPEEQIAKFIKFIEDFHNRNPEIDLKINLLGLGEVAYIVVKEVLEGEGKIYPRHEAPGEIFWQQCAERLARENMGLYIPTTHEEKSKECVSPDSPQLEISKLQNELRDYGYPIEVSGKYDNATKAWVTRFNQRYTPDPTIDKSKWSEASQKCLKFILNYINEKTNTVTQSLQSSSNLFRPIAPAPIDTSQVAQLNKR